MLVNIYGNEIPVTDYCKYFLIIDGAHRTRAVQLHNRTATPIIIPALLAELSNGETVADYLNDLNTTIRVWNTEDYMKSAANVNPGIEALERFKELMMNYGMPISTISQIYWKNKNGLNKKKLETLCKRQNTYGKKQDKIIADDFDLSRGENFIRICKQAGFTKDDIKKRYLIEQYNLICDQYGNNEFADRVFMSINTNDIESMRSTKGNLIATKVSARIARIQTQLEMEKKGDSNKNDGGEAA